MWTTESKLKQVDFLPRLPDGESSRKLSSKPNCVVCLNFFEMFETYSVLSKIRFFFNVLIIELIVINNFLM